MKKLRNRRKQNYFIHILVTFFSVVMIGMLGYFGNRIVTTIDEFPLLKKDVIDLKCDIEKYGNRQKEMIELQIRMKAQIEILNKLHRLSKRKIIGEEIEEDYCVKKNYN